MIPINKRKIGVCILLSIVTLGIYQIYWEYLLVKNTRAIKKDGSSCAGEMLCLIFVPFYSLFWWFTRGKIVKDEFAKHGHSAIGNEIAYLILSIFGLDIVSMSIMQNDFNSLSFDSTQSIQRSAIKKDRLRYTKNKLSSNLALLGIVFDALYFISLYSSDVGNYFYTYIIGASVVYNLVFLLCAFLSSEGVKNYKFNYSVMLIAVGVLQAVRIFYIPLKAHSSFVTVGAESVRAMGNGQFIYVVICLALSAAACIASGIIGIIRNTTLENYKKQLASAGEAA